jgi:ketosteroid isomerase-like protein
MPGRNAEIVTWFMDVSRHDPDAGRTVFHEDVEWEITALAIPGFPDSFHGLDGVQEFFRRWVGSFDNWDYEVEEVIEAGDSVILHVHQWGTGRGSGAPVDGRFWEVWIMRDGRAARVLHRLEKEDALEAASEA